MRDEETRKAALLFLGLPANASEEKALAAIQKLSERRLDEYYRKFVEPFEPPAQRVICIVEDETAWSDIKALEVGDPSADHPADAFVPVVPADYTHDPDFDGPLIVALRRERNPRRPGATIRVERPVKQDPAYRQHVRRLNDAGYEAVLNELKLVVSPRQHRQPPSPRNYYRYDRLMLVPYTREFIRLTRQILEHPKAKSLRPVLKELNELTDLKRGPEYWVRHAYEAARVIDKLLVRGADMMRGRPRSSRPADNREIISALREDAPRLRTAVQAIARRLSGSEDEIAAKRELTRLMSDLGLSGKTHVGRVDRLQKTIRVNGDLRLKLKPQKIVNKLLAWKHSLREAEVGRLIAVRADRRRRPVPQ